jgi:hydrogenase-1 operon protein HyaF
VSLGEIPVVAVSGETSAGNVMAIVSEIEALLGALVVTGCGGSIDLRGMPLSPGEYETLADFLGEGEVSADIDALGPTRVRETGVPGVWWVQHRNSSDQVTAELIEVTYLPEILRTDPADARAGLERLRDKMPAGDNTGAA